MLQLRTFPGLAATAALVLTLVAASGCEQPTAVAGDTLTNDGAGAPPGKRPVIRLPPEQDSFTDQLDAYDTARWFKADGWKNGSPFDNSWRADHITFAGGTMTIRLDDQGSLGAPYASGNYQSMGFHGYGCYETSMRPAARAGVVSSFFTFAGPYDNGGNGSHNEIDIEFLGNQFHPGNTWVQFNFYTNDDSYSSRNEHLHPLGFDAASGFHRYGFRWTATGITWFVDGQQVHAVTSTAARPTPKASESLQKIMMNVWPVDASAAGWAGTFDYPGEPMAAEYEWVRFTRGDSCTFAAAPQEPEQPPPAPEDPYTLRVADITLELASRDAQAVARVRVVDGAGRPVAGATVTGAWSGIAKAGDTRRDTGNDGIATFYSARFKESGSMTFCVTGVSRSGSTYDPAANATTCSTSTK